MRIRPAKIADIPGMMSVERQSSSAAHWTRPQYESMFGSAPPQTHSERTAFVVDEQFGEARESGSREGSAITGFLVAHRIGEEWELENIVVAEAARRRGIATSLMRAFLEDVQTKSGTGVILEVRQSNQSARALYRKLGFREAGVRKEYYADPAEDAILCHLAMG